MVITDSVADFSMGRVVDRTFGVIKRNLVTFLLVSAVLMIPVIAINLYNGTPNAIEGGASRGFLFGTLAFVIQLVCTYLLQASLAQGTITTLNGEPASMGEALSTGFSLAVPVCVIAILSLLGIGLGVLLLIVPGIIIGLAWSVAVPVRVVERTGIKETLSRSWDLTKGYRWRIFWLVLMYSIAAALLSFVVTLITGVASLGAVTALNSIPYIILEWVLRVILAVVTAVGITSIYYELRTVKEGLGPQGLAAAFD